MIKRQKSIIKQKQPAYNPKNYLEPVFNLNKTVPKIMVWWPRDNPESICSPRNHPLLTEYLYTLAHFLDKYSTGPYQFCLGSALALDLPNVA